MDLSQEMLGLAKTNLDSPRINFTLSQLEYFVTAAQTGSFTAAATELGISQPAVAEQIQRLERSAGQSLFARQARGVTLTSAGRTLEAAARNVLDAAAAALDTMHARTQPSGASVAIGIFGASHHYSTADMIASFLETNPDARIQVVGRNSSATADAVRSGSLEAAVVVLPVDQTGLNLRPIFEGEVYYISGNPEHVQEPVTIESICERNFIAYEASAGTSDPTRTQLAERAQAAGLQLHPRIEIETAETALALAVLGLGDTYVPQVILDTIDPSLMAASFDPPLVDTFAVITRSGSRLSRPTADLVEQVTQHLLQRINK